MDNIKDTITNVTKTFYKTSKGFLKSTKLTMDLAGEESKLKAIYIEIGKKVHEIYTYGGSLGKFFDERYQELLDCENRIDALRKELDEAKGSRTCAKCAKTVSYSAEFCPKCGTKVNEAADPGRTYSPPMIETSAGYEPQKHREVEAPERYEYVEPAPSGEPAAAKEKKCQICGRENAAENKFCFSCGRIL